MLDGKVPQILSNPEGIPTMALTKGRYVHFSPWALMVSSILSNKDHSIIADRLTQIQFPLGPFISRELPPVLIDEE